ncbi:neuroguidin [Phtheirospermum japonicum]|uniref:Neuroguidin n=1 Tax=Phtheirospermum japonicum TaxID=374723 RepID=A0A830BMK9_9LAMI|nr:neuroguidin [Phtheirospermum japonicum]
MTEAINAASNNERISRESPQLVALLKEMKGGLDTVSNKIQALTAKVKSDNLPTADGISYLETKHLLLLNYCQSLVYFLLCKAKRITNSGFAQSIGNSNIKFKSLPSTTTKTAVVEGPGSDEKKADETQKTEDLLKYRPNPNLLESKINTTKEEDGVYRPPKFAPSAMEDNKMTKQQKNAMRRDKEIVRQARQSGYVRELINDMEGKPEEVRENLGSENKEVTDYIARMEDRARREEELFTRAPLTKEEKKKLKHIKNSRNGLLGLTESFYDEIKTLPIEGDAPESTRFSNATTSGDRKFKKRKRLIEDAPDLNYRFAVLAIDMLQMTSDERSLRF